MMATPDGVKIETISEQRLWEKAYNLTLTRPSPNCEVKVFTLSRMRLLTAILLIGLLTAQGYMVHGWLFKKSRPKASTCDSTSTSCPDFTYDAVYDLESNSYTTSQYVTQHLALSGTGCSTRGTLKIALASAATDPNRRRVLIDLFFDNPTDWIFNLGDSSTNNGYAGDSGTQTWDAEIQGNKGTTFAGYLSDEGGSVKVFDKPNFIGKRLTLIAGDGHIVWLHDNNDLFNYYYNPKFFGLNGQADGTGSVNYDLYLGVNQVVDSNSGRTGSGLCKVGIKFLPEY